MERPPRVPRVSRRRVLTILAAAGAAPWPGRAWGEDLQRFEWTGAALGTQARIVLYHRDRNVARAAVADCVAEIARLEREFSLYRAESALSRLNRDGRLEAPSHDMRRLLVEAIRFGDLSDGAFDVSVQPLWRLLAGHFAKHPEARDGPAAERIAAARRRVDYRRIDVGPSRVSLGPGMALTLNGIAQGYITDRVADLLRARGWSNVLIDLGEIRALDGRPGGEPWTVGLGGSAGPGRSRLDLALDNRALATSAGAGTPFDRSGRHHHLIDPATGRSRATYRSVTVIAPRATTADALSTALYLVPPAAAESLLRAAGPAEAWLIHAAGNLQRLVA